MPRYQATPPDADTLRRAQERASLDPYAQAWDEPPTHLPVEANVVVGEIEPPLYLDDDEQRSINGAIISRHSVVSRHSVSRSGPSAPTPIRARPQATPPPALVEAPTPPSRHKKAAEGPSIAVHAKARAEAAKPAPAPAPAPAPQEAEPPQRPSPMPQLPGVDPLLIPTPPELAPTIFSWVRRRALQLDLKNADRMLRDALLDVTSSLSVAIVYPGAEELYSLAADEEVPADPSPLIMVAQCRRAMIASHTAIIPIITTGETVGVILLQRNPRNPGYTPIEQVSMLCLSREVAAIMHNLAVEHVQKQTEVKADAGSLYRGEALEAHRSRGAEGHALQLSPGWVRRTYPILIIGLFVAIVFSVFIHVPTYTRGVGVIIYPAARVVSTGGLVDKIFVTEQTQVKKGAPLFSLFSKEEQANLDQRRKEFYSATWEYLQDPNNPQAAHNVIASKNELEKAKKALSLKTVIADKDGVIVDLHVKANAPLQAGELAMRITAEDALPEVFAIMPGGDRPRLRSGQEFQMNLAGFNKSRERAPVDSVANEIYSAAEVAKKIGPEFADALPREGSFAIAHGILPKKTFKADKREMFFFYGQPVEIEIKVGSKPFLVSLLPALEKYLPD